MIDQVQNALLPDTNASITGQKNNATNTSGMESFHGALKDAVSSTLERFGVDPGNVKISITRADTRADDSSESPLAESHESIVAGKSGQTSSGSSNVSTSGSSSPSENSSTSGASSTNASSGPPDNGYDPFLQAAYSNPFASLSTSTAAGSGTAAANTAGANAAASTASGATAETPQETFDNAYWASQPPAVQVLRTMTDQDERTDTASQLANEGYSIDVPIMVWGWDPYTTTNMREAEGYTWVPSALQQPVEVAPGLSAFGNMGTYNSSNPPAGSIAV
jgi:hypothetical protein